MQFLLAGKTHSWRNKLRAKIETFHYIIMLHHNIEFFIFKFNEKFINFTNALFEYSINLYDSSTFEINYLLL